MKEELESTGKIVAALAGIYQPWAAIGGSIFFESLTLLSAKKQAAFLSDIEGRLKALEATGVLAINDLAQKESFLELLLTAVRVAARTARKEKMERLKNAVIYCAREPVSTEQSDRFLHLFEQLTVEHFTVLSFVAERSSDVRRADSLAGVYDVFKRHHPELSFDAMGHYMYDLKYRRLIRMSDEISDDDHLRAADDYRREKGQYGENFIISSVGQQLLDITRNA